MKCKKSFSRDSVSYITVQENKKLEKEKACKDNVKKHNLRAR